MKILYINLFIIFIAFSISVLKYKDYKNTVYKYFTFIIGINFLADFLGYIFGVVLKIDNSFVYNFIDLVLFPFYFLLYKKFFKQPKNKKIMNLFIFIFFAVVLFEWIVLKKPFFNSSHNYILITGSILVAVTLILFLIEIINNEKIIYNITKSLVFWFSVGSLLFYVGIVPIFIIDGHINFKELYTYIITGLIVVMYSTFIYGYIVSDPKNIF
jgi:hypothetical protein